MDTTTAQTPQYQTGMQQNANQDPVSDSYADAYVPPAPPVAQPLAQQPVADPVVEAMAEPQPEPVAQPLAQPVADSAVEPEADSSAVSPASTEALADQNIFEMLGVTTGTPEQREQFLDELQQVIWEDFIEHDTTLLLTDAEQAELKTIMQGVPDKSLEQQEKVVVYLEKLIPDLEDIMLEKALQLKEEMARERLRALRELHRNESEKVGIIDQAEQAMNQEQWQTATTLLNTIN